MDTLSFLEHMAKSVHYDIEFSDLIDSQPIEVTIAYQTNNSDLLKEYFGDTEYVANPTDVVQF